MTREPAMDRASDRLLALHLRMVGLRVSWGALSTETRRRQFEILQEDYANLITPAMREAWRLGAEQNGITLPEDNDNA